MACLDRRREELRALLEMFASADRTVVERSYAALGGLAPVEVCADVESLSARVPLPESPAAEGGLRDEDHVVMIDGGRLVLAGPIEELVERTGVLRVEVGGRPDALRALSDVLERRGMPVVEIDAQTLDVDTGAAADAPAHLGRDDPGRAPAVDEAAPDPFDAVRDACAELGLRLYRLSSRHHSLDELFLEEATGAAHGGDQS
jgi:hypothetical protein